MEGLARCWCVCRGERADVDTVLRAHVSEAFAVCVREKD